ncbi:MAG: glycosyl hydrolase [Clostridia bacterium]|nr:glycosyl hydrolase [Clostridia bacterium]
MDIKKLLKELSLEEKASLCSGLDSWHTVPIERLGIPSIMMADGPHGLRIETEGSGEDLLAKESYPATCFPTASALACSWDTELMYKLGSALGEECLAGGVSILLGPGVNIKRSPLCGRNFEYYSEDPLLSGELAVGFIRGVQDKGVGVSLKHFAVNNQETARMTTDVLLDERALREIYLTNFEIAVKAAKPWTLMCAYNMLRGEYCSENKLLLTDILRSEWGFEGLVMSDWGAVNERDDGLAGGLDLEMPAGGQDSIDKIVNAVKSGKLSEQMLDTAVERILTLVNNGFINKKENAHYDKQEHHELARKLAGECMVLLKNDNILPLKKTGSLAVIGAFAASPRIQGGGSSHLNPTAISIPLDEIKKMAGQSVSIFYSPGYRLEDKGAAFGSGFASICDIPDDELIEDAVQPASNCDITVLFLGLPDSFESEGYDRTHIRLPFGQLKLLEELKKAAKNIVVVLMNGSPVEMPWLNDVDAVLESYLGGQAAGGAIADILFGYVNPCGKLAETFPIKLSDNPSYLSFPGSNNKVEYSEGIFVGYRYYEKKQLTPLFPFGFGLSYTEFAYTNIEIDKDELDESETVTVKVSVKNVGAVAGKEIVQLYVRSCVSGIIRPEKELKGFAKIVLEPGEEKTVSLALDKRAFSCYDEAERDWIAENGEFEILVGGSSAHTPLKATIKLNSNNIKRTVFTRNSTIGDLLADPVGSAILSEMAGDEYIASLPAFVLQMPLRSIHMQMPEVDEAVISGLLEVLNS